MNHYKIFSIFVLLLFVAQSCVLEERIHLYEDLSGIYEMSFALESIDDGDEEGGLSDDFKNNVDSLANEINSLEGVMITSQDITNDGFNLSMTFDDLESLNLINNTNDGHKGQGRFELKDKKLYFEMNTNLIMDENEGDVSDKQSSKSSKKTKLSEDDRQWVKHRVVITFDKKIKKLRSDGFKKVDKNTLVYDSDKIKDKENISFSIKYK